jgi:hypothetical protein
MTREPGEFSDAEWCFLLTALVAIFVVALPFGIVTVLLRAGAAALQMLATRVGAIGEWTTERMLRAVGLGDD